MAQNETNLKTPFIQDQPESIESIEDDSIAVVHFSPMRNWDAFAANSFPFPPITVGDTVYAQPYFYHEEFYYRADDGSVHTIEGLKTYEIERYLARAHRIQELNAYFAGFRLQPIGDIYQTMEEDFDSYMQLEVDSMFSFVVTMIARMLCCDEVKENERDYLMPSGRARLTLLVAIGRAMLNGFFIYWTLAQFRPHNPIEKSIAIVIAVLEGLLYLFPLIIVMYMTYDIARRVCRQDSIHFQSKNLAYSLQDLTDISIMRYLPNTSSTMRAATNGSEWRAKKHTEFLFEKEYMTWRLRYLPYFKYPVIVLLDLIGPVISLFALAFKMTQMYFLHKSFINWTWFDILIFLAFVNQIAGIRDIESLEREAVEGFVFSGSNAFLSEAELHLLHAWYNYSVMLCLAQLGKKEKYGFRAIDFVVFWFDLTPRKLQYLFKKHNAEGDHYYKQESHHTDYVLREFEGSFV